MEETLLLPITMFLLNFKQMSKAILVFFLVTFSSLSYGQNSKLDVTSNAYEMTIVNISDLTLNIQTRGRKNTGKKTLDIRDTLFLNGRFTEKKLSNIDIICSYNDKTLHTDSLRNYKNYISWQNNNENSLEYDLEQGLIKLGSTLSAQIAESNFQKDSDDGYLEGIVKSTVNNISWATKKVVGAYESVKNIDKNLRAMSNKSYTEEINNKSYTNYFELIRDVSTLVKNEKELEPITKDLQAFLNKVSDIVGDYWEENTKEYVKERVVIFTQEVIEDSKKYIRNSRKALASYEERKSELLSYRNSDDFSETYTYQAWNLAKRNNPDFRIRSPKLLYSIDLFCFGSDLNKHLTSTPEKVLVKKGEDDYDWGGALFNRNIGGGIHFPISKEQNYSKKFYSKIYGGISFYNSLFDIQEDIRITDNFFSTSPSNSTGFNLSEPIKYEHRKLSADIVWRFFIGDALFIDLNGGYSRHKGELNLNKSELSQGYEWENEVIEIVDESYQPFFGGKIGIGKNRFFGNGKFENAGHLSIGVHFFKTNQTNNTEFLINDSNTDLPIQFNSNNKYIHRVHVGISIAI